MIILCNYDMFTVQADIRINTVNCVGAMGKGVALAFKRRYPKMFEDYHVACNAGKVVPGKLHIWTSPLSGTIVNFPTKRHWSENSRYSDIASGLAVLRTYLNGEAAKNPGLRVTIPALGCGHGGLSWARVLPMIRMHLDDIDAEIYLFEPKVSRAIS